MIKYVN